MADDLTKRGPADRSKINVHEAWELRYWTGKFGCTAEELKSAVTAVGTSAAKVEEYLKRQ